MGSCYDVPDSYANLSELAAPCPVENFREEGLYRHHTLEEALHEQQIFAASKDQRDAERKPHNNFFAGITARLQAALSSLYARLWRPIEDWSARYLEAVQRKQIASASLNLFRETN